MRTVYQPVHSDWNDITLSTACKLGACCSPNQQMGVPAPHGFCEAAAKDVHQLVNGPLLLIRV